MQIDIPDNIIKFQLEFARYEKIWFTWALTTTHWYRGKGTTIEASLAMLKENMEKGTHLGVKPKVTTTSTLIEEKDDMASNASLSDLF